jgi:hypothetical protein
MMRTPVRHTFVPVGTADDLNKSAPKMQPPKPTIRRSKMSDQVNRNPQHNDPQKPGSEQKHDNPSTQPVQRKEQGSCDHPKSPQSEQQKNDQEKKQA